MDKNLAVRGGYDGNKFYILNHPKKTVHADFDFSVLGQSRGFIYSGLVAEFVANDPFSAEIETTNKILNGIVEVEGEPCYKIHLKFKEDSDQEDTYFISTKDYILRKRTTRYTDQDGQRGGTTYTLTNLVINPKLKPNFFVIPIPEGYTKTNKPHQR